MLFKSRKAIDFLKFVSAAQGVEMAAECKAAKLDGFPMWIINGNRYSGEQRFSQLEAALQKQQS